MANINWDSQELESTAAQVNTLLQNYGGELKSHYRFDSKPFY